VNGDLASLISDLTRSGASSLVGTVDSVNSDGTVSVWVRGASLPLAASRSYLLRAAGDTVLVTVRAGELIVEGTVGSPYTVPALPAETISDLSAPSGVGWQEIVTGQVWVRQLVDGGPIEKWYKRIAAYVPPAPTPSTPATLALTAVGCDTYRGGTGLGRGYAEQGDYSGNGLQTGVWVFGTGAWAPLSGKTIQTVRARIQRRSTPHGSYGSTLTHLWLHGAAIMPQSTPSLIGPEHVISLALGQEWTGNVPIPWGTALQSGAAQGVAISTSVAAENVEAYAALTLYVDYT
jgi:hypothetical protein